MGQRATVSGSAMFTDVPVDPALVMPYAGAFEVPQQLGARQLVHAAIQVGIAGGALRDARWFIRERRARSSRPPGPGWRRGQRPTRTRSTGSAGWRRGSPPRRRCCGRGARSRISRPRRPRTAHGAGARSIAIAQAKAFASEVAAEVTSDMFALAGASAADENYDLSRHWRNARTHASHDPVSWKYHHIGNYLLNDVLPPNHGQFLADRPRGRSDCAIA